MIEISDLVNLLVLTTTLAMFLLKRRVQACVSSCKSSLVREARLYGSWYLWWNILDLDTPDRGEESELEDRARESKSGLALVKFTMVVQLQIGWSRSGSVELQLLPPQFHVDGLLPRDLLLQYLIASI